MTSFERSQAKGLASMMRGRPGQDMTNALMFLAAHGTPRPGGWAFWAVPRQEQWVIKALEAL